MNWAIKNAHFIRQSGGKMNRRERIIGVSAGAAVLTIGMIAATAVMTDVPEKAEAYFSACYGSFNDPAESRISADHLAADTTLCQELKDNRYQIIESQGSDGFLVSSGKGDPETTIRDGEIHSIQGIVVVNEQQLLVTATPSAEARAHPEVAFAQWQQVVIYLTDETGTLGEPSSDVTWTTDVVERT